MSTSAAKILLVDDDESFRPAVQKSLEKQGFLVTPAANGAIAHQLFLTGSFDLVISDIRMPEMGGIELTRLIKSGARPSPVLLITGFSEILETQEAYKMGADAFLAKPLKRAELTEAIAKCLAIGKTPAGASAPSDESTYCRMAIEDFTSGRQIQFNVFIQLSPSNYVKIGHQGENLSVDKVRVYKSKGINHLYLRREDFCTYVGFNLTPPKTPGPDASAARDKRQALFKRAGEALKERIRLDGVDKGIFDGSFAFVETTLDVICEDPEILALLEGIAAHTDHLYAHSIGVCLYSVMIARAVEWNLPNNRFKVAMGGLLHDVGERWMPSELLKRPRREWKSEELKVYEGHPLQGAEALAKIKSIPPDVIQIVKEHHENCMAQGFPARLKRTTIHPMAKLVAVANAFCELVVKTPNGDGIAPTQALQQLNSQNTGQLDSQFLDALNGIFDFTPDGQVIA